MGTGSTIVPGDVQRMSAGSGVQHSEYNHDKAGVTHFLQIWIEPNVRGIPPGYEQKHFDAASKRGRLRLVASPDGADGSVTIHQDARIYAGLFDGAERAAHALAAGRRAYVHVARGTLTVNGTPLDGGRRAQDDRRRRSRAGKGRAAPKCCCSTCRSAMSGTRTEKDSLRADRGAGRAPVGRADRAQPPLLPHLRRAHAARRDPRAGAGQALGGARQRVARPARCARRPRRSRAPPTRCSPAATTRNSRWWSGRPARARSPT